MDAVGALTAHACVCWNPPRALEKRSVPIALHAGGRICVELKERADAHDGIAESKASRALRPSSAGTPRALLSLFLLAPCGSSSPPSSLFGMVTFVSPRRLSPARSQAFAQSARP